MISEEERRHGQVWAGDADLFTEFTSRQKCLPGFMVRECLQLCTPNSVAGKIDSASTNKRRDNAGDKSVITHHLEFSRPKDPVRAVSKAAI